MDFRACLLHTYLVFWVINTLNNNLNMDDVAIKSNKQASLISYRRAVINFIQWVSWTDEALETKC